MSRNKPASALVREQDLPDSKPGWCKMSTESFEKFKTAALGEPVPSEYLADEEGAKASGFKSAAHCWLMQCLQG